LVLTLDRRALPHRLYRTDGIAVAATDATDATTLVGVFALAR
jgi:hypothetical protein